MRAWALVLVVAIGCSSVRPKLSAPRPKLAPPAAGVTLGWDYDAGATNVAGFNLYWGTSSGVYTNLLQIPYAIAREASVTNLARGNVYYFAATAYDSGGLESQFSNEISYALPALQVLTLTIYGAADPSGPWVPLAGLDSLTVTNTGLPAQFFRLGVQSP